MELIIIVILAALLPIMSISSFIIGYNMTAPKKVHIKRKKKEEREMTEDEIMLDRIDKARI